MKRINEQSLIDHTRFKTLYDLSRMLDQSEQEILDFALEAGVTVTGSKIGYIYFANSDETKLYLHAWSKNVMPQCSVESYPDAYLVSETGLWGEAVRQRKAVITDNYDLSPYKKGYPQGHVPVQNHMNLPVFDNGKIVIIAGVGNKAGTYSEEDVQQLSLIMDGTWNIVKRKRVEEELKKTNENLEKIIDERTVELQSANEELHSIIDKQSKTEATLAKSEAVFKGVFDNAFAGIMLLSPDGKVTLANKICAQLLGYTREEMSIKNMADFIHPDDLTDALKNMEAHLKNNESSWHNERKLITKEQKPIWGNLNITVLKDRNDKIESLLMVVTDITEQKKLETHLQLLSITDPLTNAKNRRFFMENAQKEMIRSQRYATPLSMMMMDIDHFKNINDTHGHGVGDTVLIELVKSSESVLRNTDIFCRIGGEEFVGILIETDLKKAELIAERLRKELEDLCIKTDKGEVRFTVSLGLTQMQSHEDSLEKILKRADKALYAAKRKGRNKVVILN